MALIEIANYKVPLATAMSAIVAVHNATSSMLEAAPLVTGGTVFDSKTIEPKFAARVMGETRRSTRRRYRHQTERRTGSKVDGPIGTTS
jgi:hypothetical protein